MIVRSKIGESFIDGFLIMVARNLGAARHLALGVAHQDPRKPSDIDLLDVLRNGLLLRPEAAKDGFAYDPAVSIRCSSGLSIRGTGHQFWFWTFGIPETSACGSIWTMLPSQVLGADTSNSYNIFSVAKKNGALTHLLNPQLLNLSNKPYRKIGVSQGVNCPFSRIWMLWLGVTCDIPDPIIGRLCRLLMALGIMARCHNCDKENVILTVLPACVQGANQCAKVTVGSDRFDSQRSGMRCHLKHLFKYDNLGWSSDDGRLCRWVDASLVILLTIHELLDTKAKHCSCRIWCQIPEQSTSGKFHKSLVSGTRYLGRHSLDNSCTTSRPKSRDGGGNCDIVMPQNPAGAFFLSQPSTIFNILQWQPRSFNLRFAFKFYPTSTRRVDCETYISNLPFAIILLSHWIHTMASNSNNSHTRIAAKEREPEPRILIRELITWHNRPIAKYPPRASELGLRYHKTLDQMRDACLFALEHRHENKIALRDLAAVEPRFGQQIMGRKTSGGHSTGALSLRLYSNPVTMKKHMDNWTKFCKEQISKGGPNAMMYLYGVEGWEDLWLLEGEDVKDWPKGHLSLLIGSWCDDSMVTSLW